MYALTFKQPYATAALTVKLLDNRPRAPTREAVGTRIAIHAGLTFDHTDAWGLKAKLTAAWYELHKSSGKTYGPNSLVTGAILGTVLLKGFARVLPDGSGIGYGSLSGREVSDALGSKWRVSSAKCLWVFDQPRILERPIPCRGAQGMWRVPPHHWPALGAE